MKFECGDLERALAVSDLMPEAREHLKICAVCRREYWLWTEISASARTLHEDWESPALWSNIRASIEADQKPRPAWWKGPKMWAVAAVVAMAVSIPLFLRLQSGHYTAPQARHAGSGGGDRDFLTEQALADVEKSEAAYRHSIETLSRLSRARLDEAGSPAAVNTREKLLLLDSAIRDTRANVAVNRFNVRLQTTLADLYREKQQTLEELLKSNANN